MVSGQASAVKKTGEEASVKVQGWAAKEKGAPLVAYTYELGELGPDQVDIKVTSCGICHSDLAMIENEWGMSSYPAVFGHEVVGKITAVGNHVKHLKAGQHAGLGWFSGSCMHCRHCMHGDHNLCDTPEQTIIGRAGGFADHVRCNAEWAVPIPESLKENETGPLFCGGITVFNPIVQYDVLPTQRVGVIGIGGLGHLALQFLNKWGCEVTAFSSTPGKEAEAKRLGAHYVVNSKDSKAMEKLAGRFDFIVNTTNANLDWNSYIGALAPRGRLHTVGVMSDPIPASAFAIVGKQRSISGSPLGSPATIGDMLEFCARHKILPVNEHFPMKDINKALDHLRAGKARYRIVLDN